MFRTLLTGAILAGAAGLAEAQSASAVLTVTATVVSTCQVNAPRHAEPSRLSTLPVAVTCVRGRVAPRVQRPAAPRRSEARDAVLLIDF